MALEAIRSFTLARTGGGGCSTYAHPSLAIGRLPLEWKIKRWVKDQARVIAIPCD
jgi:hypothetical protein